jgi:hypothetical protein
MQDSSFAMQDSSVAIYNSSLTIHYKNEAIQIGVITVEEYRL